MEAGGETIERTGPLRGVPTWGLVAGAVALIAAVLIALAVAGGDSLPDRPARRSRSSRSSAPCCARAGSS